MMVDVQTIGVLVAAISVSIAAIYYVMTLRVQQKNMKHTLETRQTQLFMQLLTLYDNKEFLKDFATTAYLTKYEDYNDWLRKYGPQTNLEHWASWARVGRFFDGTGILVKRNLVDADLVIDEMREQIILTWDIVKPWVTGVREVMNSPNTWENFEYLAGEARRRNPGIKSVYDIREYESKVVGEAK